MKDLVAEIFSIRQEINLGYEKRGLYLSGRRCGELVGKLDRIAKRLEALDERKTESEDRK